MKNIWLGIVALGLIIWPVIALSAVWADQNAYRARQQLEGPLVMSWIVGSILAICGIIIRCDKSPALRLSGRILCVSALCIEAAIFLYFAIDFASQLSHFGVN